MKVHYGEGAVVRIGEALAGGAHLGLGQQLSRGVITPSF